MRDFTGFCFGVCGGKGGGKEGETIHKKKQWFDIYKNE